LALFLLTLTKICDDEEVPKESRYTHYEFLKEVGLYWMNPPQMEAEEVVVDYGKGIFSPSASTVSTLTASSSKKAPSSRGKYVTDKSLSPDGKFNKRLYDSKLHFGEDCVNYICEKQDEPPTCRLHNWFGGKSKYKIMHCPVCDINLCVNCYKLFHTEANLVDMKAKLKKQYERQLKKKR